MEGDATFAVRLDAAHLGTAEATGAADADALGTELHRGLQRLLHGATEGDTTLELGGDVLGHELRVGLRLADFLDVDEDFVGREGLHARELGLAFGGGGQVADLEGLDALAALADHHTRTRRVDDDLGFVRRALDFDARDVGVGQVVLHRTLDADVLVKPSGILLVLVPLRVPGLDDAEAEPIRVSLLSHLLIRLSGGVVSGAP